MKEVYAGKEFVGYLTEDWMLTYTELSLSYTKDNLRLFTSVIDTEDNTKEYIHKYTKVITKEGTNELNSSIITNDSPKAMPMHNLRVIQGDGGGTSSGNWLLDLPIGTKFSVVSRDNPKNFMALDLEMVNKGPHSAVLYELSSGQPMGGSGRVVASRFVGCFQLLEIIPTYEEMIEKFQEEQRFQQEQSKTQEASDGRSNWTTPLVPRGQD